jgi:hypothetical protein
MPVVLNNSYNYTEKIQEETQRYTEIFDEAVSSDFGLRISNQIYQN